MIRRDRTAADGMPAWVLIPQIEHAHLSGDLADAWRFEVLPDAFLAELRYASRHHDDGWHEWDEHPGVDSSGAPTNFDAMQLADSLSIWERSIELSTTHSPLAGYLVAGHFCRLLERFDSWKNKSATATLACEFLASQHARMSQLVAARQTADEPADRQALAELGVDYVQLFDALSLSLCTRERHDSWQASLAAGGTWTLTPLAPYRVRIEPWPLAMPELRLHVSGRRVPQARYATANELAVASGDALELKWTLVAGQ